MSGPRKVSRGLLLTSGGELLLVRSREPSSGREFWYAPGGGREEGEIAASSASFAPRRLAELLRSLVRDGPPARALDAGA